MSRTSEKYGAVVKHSNICQMEVSEKEEKKDRSTKILEAIIAEISTNFMKT